MIKIEKVYDEEKHPRDEKGRWTGEGVKSQEKSKYTEKEIADAHHRAAMEMAEEIALDRTDMHFDELDDDGKDYIYGDAWEATNEMSIVERYLKSGKKKSRKK